MATVTEIVNQLVLLNPLQPYPVGNSNHKLKCFFCNAVGPYFDPLEVFPHTEDCLWLKATKVQNVKGSYQGRKLKVKFRKERRADKDKRFVVASEATQNFYKYGTEYPTEEQKKDKK